MAALHPVARTSGPPPAWGRSSSVARAGSCLGRDGPPHSRRPTGHGRARLTAAFSRESGTLPQARWGGQTGRPLPRGGLPQPLQRLSSNLANLPILQKMRVLLSILCCALFATGAQAQVLDARRLGMGGVATSDNGSSSTANVAFRAVPKGTTWGSIPLPHRGGAVLQGHADVRSRRSRLQCLPDSGSRGESAR